VHFLARLQLRRGLQVRQRHPAYRRIMIAVIAVNCAAFMAIASGVSLQGSAPPGRQCAQLPGRRATYGISLAVIGRSVAVQSGAANGQGASLVALVLLFLSYAISRATSGAPSRGITGLGPLGFFANALAGLLLVSHCAGDANVRSLWLCARNDLTQSLASRRPAERSG
jgi:hypothetical protein